MQSTHEAAAETSSLIYLTKNTEYHVRNRICTAIRDRASGRFVSDHRALNRRLAGAMRLTLRDARLNTGEPRPGQGLCFELDEGVLLTSAIEAIEARVASERLRPTPAVGDTPGGGWQLTNE
jgi:hypothetical protein